MTAEEFKAVMDEIRRQRDEADFRLHLHSSNKQDEINTLKELLSEAYNCKPAWPEDLICRVSKAIQ